MSRKDIKIEKPQSLSNMEVGKSYVIAASAGTGKTYTLERLVLDKIIAQDVPIEKILVVTFTRRATAEMKGRIRKLLENILDTHRSDEQAADYWVVDEQARRRIESALSAFDDATISTIHGFCQELISDYAFSAGQFFDTELVDDSELFQRCFYDILREKFAIDDAYRSWLERFLQMGFGLDDLARDLRTIWSRGAIVLPEAGPAGPFDGAAPEDLEEKWQVATACWQLFGGEVAERVQAEKREKGLMSYDDLLETVQRGVAQHGELAEILRERYDVVLVDEFQDTDPVQWAIFQQVFLAADRELFVIGDKKQAIYGFRGADVGTYEEAIKDEGFDEPLTLDHNHRSSAELIDAYNRLFEEGLLQGRYEPVKAPEGGGPERRLTGEIGSEPVEVCHLPGITSRAAAEPRIIKWTADKIDGLLRCDDYRFEDDKEEERTLLPGDIYVLTRTNGEADKVGKALAQRGIPYAFYRRPGLFETEDALDILRLLRAIARPSDRSLCRKAMLTPFFAVRLDEILDYEVDSKSKTWTPRKQIEAWHQIALRRDFTALFDEVISGSGVVRRELLSTDRERRLTNYRHIFDWLLEQASRGHLGIEQLADLLQRYREGTASDGEEEDTDLQRLETDKSSVQIMTIHKSKGLQAEVVFIVGGLGKRDDKYISSSRELKVMASREEKERGPRNVAFHRKATEFLPDGVWGDFETSVIEEASRLFYVAITRAKSKVYLPYLDANAGVRKNSSYGLVCDALDGICAGDIYGLNDVEGFEVAAAAIDGGELVPAVPILVGPKDLGFDDPRFVEIAATPSPTAPGDSRKFEAIREEQRRITTSYSAMSDHGGERGEAVVERHENPLPRSINSGNFLHKVLELLDYRSANEASSPGDWLRQKSRDTTVGELLRHEMEEHNIKPPEEFEDYTATIIYEALRAPLRTDDGELAALCSVDDERTGREVNFLLPLPFGEDLVAADKGYFMGEIDLLFDDDQGRIYFADWKSDTRIGGPEYTRETLKRHVETHYRKQAAVYTTALVRMLNITSREQYDEKFGGFFYLFVRGMSADGERGQYFERVPWARVQELNKELSTQAPKAAVMAWEASGLGQGSK